MLPAAFCVICRTVSARRHASAVEFALVQEHLRETSVVTKRAAHACAARVVGGLREDTVRVEIGGAFRNGGASWRRSSTAANWCPDPIMQKTARDVD